MATNANFNKETTAQEVADAFGDQIKGRTIVLTGPSPGGIGAENARVIAAKGPKLLILAGRDMTKLESTKADILKETPSANIAFVTLDLASVDSVRSAAKDISKAANGQVDVLINNAAVMMTPYGTTTDGFETQFGTNYIGPWLLTNLVLPSIPAGGRIVFVSSVGHHSSDIRWDDIEFSKGAAYDKVQSYGQSKTAAILNAVALAAKHPKITAVSLHPGGIMTNLGRHLSKDDLDGPLSAFFDENMEPKPGVVFKTIPQGASTTMVAAFDPALEKSSGAYLANCQVAREVEAGKASLADETAVSAYAVDKGAAERLWKITEEMVGEKF